MHSQIKTIIKKLKKKSHFSFSNQKSKTKLNSSSSSTVQRLCLGKSESRCPSMPDGLLNQIGVVSLECPNGKSIPLAPYEDKMVYYALGFGGKKTYKQEIQTRNPFFLLLSSLFFFHTIANNLDYLIPLTPTDYPFQKLLLQFG